jgi:hypothetical protein
MKNKTPAPSVPYHPSEAEIREKAHELYVRSGWLPGRDLDNWLEAEAYLTLHPPVGDLPVAPHSRDVMRSLHAQPARKTA